MIDNVPPRLRSQIEWLLLLCMMPFSTGCEWGGARYPTEAATQQLVVHGMLVAGEQNQEIVLEYTRDINDGYFKGLTPASGAEVLVVAGESHRFDEDPARPGVYRAMFSPRPGTRYSLQVRGRAGEVVTAETMVPGIPQFITPSEDTTISLGNHVTFRWSSSRTAAGYIVVDGPPGQPTPALVVTNPYIRADTSGTWAPGALGGKLFHYRIAAVDSSYVRYMQGAPDAARPQRFRSTVVGGYGVFGSYAMSNTRVVTLR